MKKKLKILQLTAEGLTLKEVSKEVGLSPRYVEKILRDLRIEHKANNTVHLVATMIRSGVIK